MVDEREPDAGFFCALAEEWIDFFETQPADFPASVTPSSAAKRCGRRQKVRKPLVFLDWQAI
jgi:hypothetical protein